MNPLLHKLGVSSYSILSEINQFNTSRNTNKRKYKVCMIIFEWNSDKEQLNRAKHNVSFEEASSVFFDEHAIQFFDDAHSEYEDRFVMLGVSSKMRIIVVVHCERESGEVIRIISARRATSKEHKYYQGV